MGIPARAVRSDPNASRGAIFEWPFHAWTEAFIPLSELPRQSGTTTRGGAIETDTLDSWYVFDATDFCFLGGGCDPGAVLHGEEAIDPRHDYMRHSRLQLGYESHVSRWDGRPVGADGVATYTDVSSDYSVALDHWVTTDADCGGTLGWGDTDYFIVSASGSALPRMLYSGPGTCMTETWACPGDYPFWDKDSRSWTCGGGTEPVNDGPVGPGIWGLVVASRLVDVEVYHGNACDYTVRWSDGP